MAVRKPTVMIGGQLQDLPVADTLSGAGGLSAQAAKTFLGNQTAASAIPTELTVGQSQVLINVNGLISARYLVMN
jgi:hypothetical protein